MCYFWTILLENVFFFFFPNNLKTTLKSLFSSKFMTPPTHRPVRNFLCDHNFGLLKYVDILYIYKHKKIFVGMLREMPGFEDNFFLSFCKFSIYVAAIRHNFYVFCCCDAIYCILWFFSVKNWNVWNFFNLKTRHFFRIL